MFVETLVLFFFRFFRFAFFAGRFGNAFSLLFIVTLVLGTKRLRRLVAEPHNAHSARSREAVESPAWLGY